VDRHDNIMQRVLALREHLFITLIADGVHLPSWLLKSWLAMIGSERSVIVSDSISAAGMPAGEYSISGQTITVDDQRRTRHRDHGYLAGSASTLFDMDQWMTRSIELSDSDRELLLYTNAMKIL